MNSTQAKKLHTLLKANYRTQWDEDTDRLCSQMLPELCKEIGDERLAIAVKAMIAGESFFQIANLRKHIPPAGGPLPRHYCALCKNSEGWIWLSVEGEKGTRLYRCKHDPLQQGSQVRVRVGPVGNERSNWATVLL